MRRLTTVYGALGALLSLALLMGQGCPGITPPPSAEDLSAAERAAIDTLVEAAGALTSASSTSQSASDVSVQNAQVSPASSTGGSCPAVTGSASIENGLFFSVTIDFGDPPGCSILGQGGYLCSGNATGSYSSGDGQLDLVFNTVSCNGNSLDGSAALTYAIADLTLALTGDFDLTWVSGDDAVTAAGEGTCYYNRDTATTTIVAFDGTISDGESDWSAALYDLVVSYQNNPTLIPSAGEATVSGSEIRTLTIRFNAGSPSTGEVSVSIAGGPFFTVNLFAL